MEAFLALIDRHGRAAEFVTGSVMLVFGLTLLAPGETMRLSTSYSAFLAVGIGDLLLGGIATCVGFSRLLALVRNGLWKRSPVIRAIGAVIGMAFFVGLGAAFTWPYVAGIADAPNTGTIYFVCAVGDLLAAYRSGRDARSARMV